MTLKPKRLEPEKASIVYRQLWRVVDGAVADAFKHHPDYLTAKGQHGSTARRSIVKRVTGAVLSYVEQSTQARSGCSPAGECDVECATFASHDGNCRRLPSMGDLRSGGSPMTIHADE